jgi:hypothetical protein
MKRQLLIDMAVTTRSFVYQSSLSRAAVERQSLLDNFWVKDNGWFEYIQPPLHLLFAFPSLLRRMSREREDFQGDFHASVLI